jgi:hypothetical protein
MTTGVSEKGQSLFSSALALEETWVEVERLAEVLDDRLTKMLSGDGKLFAALKPSKIKADIPKRTLWAYQHNFSAIKRGSGKRSQAAQLNFEFRLCWPPEYKIVRADGTEAKFPLIVVKGTNRSDPFECYDLLTSPTERIGEETQYDVHRHLLWHADKNEKSWGGAFALPLFAVETEDDLMREIVRPAAEMVKVTWSENPVALEERAFAQTKSVLRWKENDQKDVILDDR